jgi:hypothetical protein
MEVSQHLVNMFENYKSYEKELCFNTIEVKTILVLN